MRPGKQELEQMKKMDVMEADINQLTDIYDIVLAPNLCAEERIQSFLEQVKNPYMVRAGDFVVKIQYSETEKTFADSVAVYLSKIMEMK